MSTVWSTNAKEGFTETPKPKTPTTTTPTDTKPETNGDVVDFGHDVYIGNDPDELILKSDPKTPLPTKQINEPTKSPTSDLFNNFSQTKAKELYLNSISNLESNLSNVHKNIGESIVAQIYGNANSNDAKKDMQILSKQIALWIAIPLSYLLLINWWYVIYYTDHAIDFRNYVIFPKIVTYPVLNAIEFVNYFIFNLRLDANSSFSIINEKPLQLWDYRPIVFSVLYAIILTLLGNVPVISGIAGILAGTSFLIPVIYVAAGFYFFKFAIDEWISKVLNAGIVIQIVTCIILFIIFILMFVIVAVVVGLYSTYLMFISVFAIFAFNWFIPGSIYSSVSRIFKELAEAPVNKPIDTMDKIKNFLFQNAFGLCMLIVISTILGINISDALQMKKELLTGLVIGFNIILALIFAPSAFTFLYRLKNLILENPTNTDDEPKSVPEKII